jgi:flagellar basal-body rod modification protein FlgD
MTTVPGVSSESLRIDYLKLLVTQLQNQNPLEPVSNTEFTAQLAQMSQLEQLENLNTSFAGVLKVQQEALAAQQWGQAASLLGRQVTYKASEGAASGTVTKVSQTDHGVVLLVGDTSVSIDDVQSVQS